MSDEQKTEQTPAQGAPSSGKRFMVVWFVIPIVVVIVLAFLK